MSCKFTATRLRLVSLSQMASRAHCVWHRATARQSVSGDGWQL